MKKGILFVLIMALLFTLAAPVAVFADDTDASAADEVIAEENAGEENTDEDEDTEESADEETTDEETADEVVTDEETADEVTTDEETTDEEATDEEVADTEATDEETANEETETTETAEQEASETPVSLSVSMGIDEPVGAKFITGELIGTPGWGGNEGADYNSAFDGNVDTFFDPEGVGEQYFAGMELDGLYMLTEVRIHPRSSQLGRFNGATIQASVDGENWTNIWTSSEEATEAAFQIITADMLENNFGWSYYRYVNNTNHGDVAEVEFWGKPVVTRAEAIAEIIGAIREASEMMIEKAGLPPESYNDGIKLILDAYYSGEEFFNDVDESHEYYDEIRFAKALGLIVGNGASAFKPDKVLSRQDFAIILIRLANYSGTLNPEDIEEIDIADIDTVESYAQEAVKIAAGLGIMELSEGKFNPLNGTAFDDLMYAFSVPMETTETSTSEITAEVEEVEEQAAEEEKAEEIEEISSEETVEDEADTADEATEETEVTEDIEEVEETEEAKEAEEDEEAEVTEETEETEE